MYCIVLHCIVLHCIVLHCITMYCVVLHCIALYCIVLHCIANLQCCVVQNDVSFLASIEVLMTASTSAAHLRWALAPHATQVGLWYTVTRLCGVAWGAVVCFFKILKILKISTFFQVSRFS